MVNGLGVLGWGVGGIEAEAAMLGHPVFLPYPVVTGVRLVGRPQPGVLATDVVLTLTQALRAKGVTGHFIEFFGEGVHALSVPDRATVANMAPEYGATCALFPIDALTLDYLRLTGRSEASVQLVQAYARHQSLWDRTDVPTYGFDDVVTFDLGSVETSVAGPDRPHDRMPVSALAANFASHFAAPAIAGEGLTNGDIVIAAITSCTNTSNPEGMIAAGLVARNARRLGLKLPGHVKASIAPGSQAVSRYLSEAGLLADLEAIGFTLIGFGCTTCVGNSGELAEEVASRIRSEGLTVASVISGNRNFEGRIHPLVKANYLASPPMVVACALAGSVLRPQDRLQQLWPRPQEVQELVAQLIRPAVFQQAYRELYDGGAQWDALEVGRSVRYPWPPSSYISPPSFFSGTARIPRQPILSAARALLILGDGITTDHISPVGRIVPESDAGAFLTGLGIRSADFNAYGARRGNEEVMVRGTFANVQLKNEMAPGRIGPWTRHTPGGEEMSVYQAAERYRRDNIPLVVVAGKDYGAGSARDWAAKGTWLLGIRAVVAESFERIHRTNLALVGVLPLQFTAGQDRTTANIGACDRFEILCGPEALRPRGTLLLRIVRENNEVEELDVICRLDTDYEIGCFRRGGLFQSLLPAASTAR
jgi:aconitate hydratase